MIITLEDTNSSQISSALLRAKRSAGSPAQGMVLTMIVVCDETEYSDALDATVEAGKEHPSRILLVVTGRGRNASVSAEVRIGEGTPGEVVVIRMRGEVAHHPASVIRPLLLPDSPVVIWWPGKVPADRGVDELGQLAMRRITDAAGSASPLRALKDRAGDYRPGDTDLSWTRLTPWRALLAAALDQYPSRIKSAVVEAEPGNPSADLLAAWLRLRLKVEVSRLDSDGPGLTAVRMATAAGDIAITRPDGLLASYAVPGQPERLVALKRRDTTDLISEELRRMDADDIFEQVIQSLVKSRTGKKSGSRKKGSGKKSAAKKGAAEKPAKQEAASQPEPGEASA